jgi:hypothetical protein
VIHRPSFTPQKKINAIVDIADPIGASARICIRIAEERKASSEMK